jgi:hypothetical protein
MRKIIITAVAALAIGGVAAAPASAANIDKLAKKDCKEERRTEPGEFENRYGGLDKAALSRCVRASKREARADCKRERNEEPGEFAIEYGGKGKAALKRCVVDELR